MKNFVPSKYVGMWTRKGIWRSNGSSDTITAVLWFQSPLFHIDLRVPPGLEDFTSPAREMDTQLAFAGVTVVEGDRCEWRPQLSFPVSAEAITEPDAGLMNFHNDSALREIGIDGSYEEEWEKIRESDVVGLKLEHVDPAQSNRRAFVLMDDAWLAIAIGATNFGFDPISASNMCEFLFAQPAATPSEWTVVRSNIPWRKGQTILTRLTSASIRELLCRGEGINVDEIFAHPSQISPGFSSSEWSISEAY